MPAPKSHAPQSEIQSSGTHDSNNAAGHTAPLETTTGMSSTRKISIARRQVTTHGLPRLFWNDIYHSALTASWPTFFGAMAVIFFVANCIFALLYQMEPVGIANHEPHGFLGALFFSIETFATVGYGHMYPDSTSTHMIASVEIFAGMSFVALFTGVMFARFSRPRARILFADHPVVGPFNGQRTLTIRAANARQNVIVDASAHLRMMRWESTQEGESMRRFYDLKLERDQNPMFIIGWNIMHIIDEQSPLWEMTAKSLEQVNAGFVLTIDGIDETTSQLMQSRFTYAPDAIRWNHRYEDLLSTDKSGKDHLDYAKFHHTVPLGSEDFGGKGTKYSDVPSPGGA